MPASQVEGSLSNFFYMAVLGIEPTTSCVLSTCSATHPGKQTEAAITELYCCGTGSKQLLVLRHTQECVCASCPPRGAGCWAPGRGWVPTRVPTQAPSCQATEAPRPPQMRGIQVGPTVSPGSAGTVSWSAMLTPGVGHWPRVSSAERRGRGIRETGSEHRTNTT